MKPILSIAAAVLAAGSSRRFGSDKRRYVLDNKPLLQQVLAKPLSMGLPVLLVLKPEDELQLSALLDPWQGNERLTIVYAERAEEGMGYSLAAAASAARHRNYDALLVMLADMPWVKTGTLRRLCESVSKDRICVPRHHGMKGNPVLLGSDWFDALQVLTGDSGARGIIQQHPEAVTWVDVEDNGVLRDLDRPPPR